MCQTAVNKAADTSNPNATCAGTTKPVGTSNRLPNGLKEVEGGKGERCRRDERASGTVGLSSNGENTVPDSIPPVPNLGKRRPPLSVPLEGEKTGQQSSGHPDKTTTHLAQHKCAQRRTLCVGQTARLKAKRVKESGTRGQVGARLPARTTNVIPDSTATSQNPHAGHHG
ncbi:hypothetical protein PAXRUDRAFT_177997 [Paxillus rubicundulus Ve08.2h10]|uniref:Uncharacterized protein n=1 Tax=Paxillus rubicundulus Ve08.2h10 TaxID=930991 RepID=A0A0D0D182_9AGAM|nr:hypothetical protein PAXRUDRAFT_177997 [Paxillus rubicundulus Ve08.2h10]